MNDRTLSLERMFSAPLLLVWEAWTQPAHIAHWWGPKGMKTEIVAHDFVEGGAWKYVMAMPDGSTFISEGVYTLIVELEQIFSSANFKPMTEGVEIQAYFKAAGDKTHFTFRVVHVSAEYAQQQSDMGFLKGWGSVFDGLGSYLETQTV